MNKDLLFNALNRITPLSTDFKNYLSVHLSSHLFHKGDQMPYRPPVSETAYFIEYGLVCGVNYLTEEKVTLWFSGQERFIIPELPVPGKQFIERIEFLSPTLLIGLEFSRMKEAIRLFPEGISVCLAIIGHKIAESNEREILLRLPSKVRYTTVFARHPQYFIESYNDNLASYLNLSTRHFARLKKQFHTNSRT